jgi:asparagine synthase (glutamine-hydrolysing)
MCGIVGAFHYRGGHASPELVARQTALLRHRGPDDQGVWSSADVAFGHRRLAIVGCGVSGHQPVCNEDGSCWLTFNGELYGWRQQRRELVARGHRMRGTSDAELALHLYEDHGEALLAQLRGEFAFAIFDRSRRRLLLARDRVGVKPLYYHDDGNRVVFASELKALLLDPSVPRDVDEEAILEYLTFQYVPAPRTIWKGVSKLPPGHRLICDAAGVRLEPYWEFPLGSDSALSEEDAADRLLELLEEAVRLRLDAHTSIGAALSGGIDSSSVVALMARVAPGRISTFSIGFTDAGFDELAEARAVASQFGTDHHEAVVEPRALDGLPHLIWGLDEPFADASILPTYYLARLASSKVKAIVSGDGGDETFAGYRTYRAAARHQRLGLIPRALRRWIGAGAARFHSRHSLGRRLRRVPMSVLDRHLEAMANFPPAELEPLLAPALRELHQRSDPFRASRECHARAARQIGEVPALLHLDAATYMADDVLKKVECAAMLNSLEVRVPLLDHRLLEFVARLPFHFKWRNGTSKWLLRRGMKDLLPERTLTRAKRGFTVPLERWFGGRFGQLVRETLLDPRARRRGWFDTQRIESLVRAGSARNTQQLWSLVCLELWAQSYLDRGRPDPVRA